MKHTNGKNLEFIKAVGSNHSLFYALDENGKRVRRKEPQTGHPAENVKGEPSYQTRICKNKNIIWG